MAVEDFTTYTEYDPTSSLTVTSTKVDFNTVYTNETGKVYKDKGVGHFGDFEHDFTVRISAKSNNSQSIYWAVMNTISTYHDIWNTTYGIMNTFYVNTSASLRIITIANADTGTGDSGANHSPDFTRYLTTERSGTTGTTKIYTDAARTNLEDTLSMTVTNTTFRYIYGFTGRGHSSGGGYQTGYTENLDLNEGGTIHYATPSDTLSVTDSPAFAQSHVYASSETVSIADSLNAMIATTFNPTDTISITDTPSWIDGWDVLDTLSISDSLTCIDNVPISDLIGITDSQDNVIGCFWYSTDSISVLDAITKVKNPSTMESSCATVYLLIDWAGQENRITKDIVVFNFWNEADLETVDKGINAQPLKLKGMFSNQYRIGTNVETVVNSINAMMNTGAEITLSTEGSCINGIYIIRNFTYSTTKGVWGTFTWTLDLEYVREA